MKKRSVVDEIAHYLQELLQEEDVVVLNRRDIAEQFHCVPSQINYVINTRFTKEKGYYVESKRGGSGYIRITKLYVCINWQTLVQLKDELNETMTYTESVTLIQRLYDEEWLNQQSAQLLATLMSDDVLGQEADVLRARLLKATLERLQYQ